MLSAIRALQVVKMQASGVESRMSPVVLEGPFNLPVDSQQCQMWTDWDQVLHAALGAVSHATAVPQALHQ